MRVLVTGGAGFVGSHLVPALLNRGDEVAVFDVRQRAIDDRLEYFDGDLFAPSAIDRTLREFRPDTVVHLLANADVKDGLRYPMRDLEVNTNGTATLLEAMRSADIKRIVFASSSAVYGDGYPELPLIPETAPFPIQTSLYGASKVAAEGLITAYVAGYGFRATILRFASMIGERYLHGHVYDFYRKLQANPERIEIIGDGTARHAYMYVGDAVAGMLAAMESSEHMVWNVGGDEPVSVTQSLDWICEYLGLDPERVYTGNRTGWAGDAWLMHMDCSRLKALGWVQRDSAISAMHRTLRYFDGHPEEIAPWV